MSVFDGKFNKVAILVSTGRTGTRALAQYLDKAYPDVKALHEPSPSRNLKRISNRYLCKRISRDDLVRALTDSRRDLLARITEPIYIESNPFLRGFLDAFDEVFGGPLIVHIVRDPRTFIRSYINFGAFRGLKGLAAAYYPFWELKPELYERSPARRWRDMSPAERGAWRWATINGELNRGEELFGERYLRLRFEDLFTPDGSGLRTLTDWIGLPEKAEVAEAARTEKVNASRDRGFPKWENLDPGLRNAVLAHCKDMMQTYGYRVDEA